MQLTSLNALRGPSVKLRLAMLEARNGDRVPTWLYLLWDQRTQFTARRATKASLGVPDHMLVEVVVGVYQRI